METATASFVRMEINIFQLAMQEQSQIGQVRALCVACSCRPSFRSCSQSLALHRSSQEQDSGGRGVVATVKRDWARIWPADMEGNRNLH